MRLSRAPETARPDGWRVTLTFDSWIPSKKNKLQPRATRTGGRGQMYKPGVRKACDDLLLQAKTQWAGRPPMIHPRMEVRLAGPDSQDVDGMLTTLLDALVKAGVLVDDAIRVNNGRKVILPAIADGQSTITLIGPPVDTPEGFDERLCRIGMTLAAVADVVELTSTDATFLLEQLADRFKPVGIFEEDTLA